VVKPKPEVVFQEIEGELVLLDLDAGSYYALDEVGARCWELILEHDDLDGVVAAMLAEFEVDEATLRADLDVLFGQLRDAGLVTEAYTSA
jgi:hypothetical protein